MPQPLQDANLMSKGLRRLQSAGGEGSAAATAGCRRTAIAHVPGKQGGSGLRL